jgi:acyl carrier protein
MSVLDRVTAILAKDLGVDAADVTPDASIIMDLGADSLALAELTVKLEREFQIRVEDRDLRKLETVEDVVRLIEARAKV